MSTKGTIWISDDASIHIYDECFDDEGYVYIGTHISTESGEMTSQTTIILPLRAVKAIARHMALHDEVSKRKESTNDG